VASSVCTVLMLLFLPALMWGDSGQWSRSAKHGLIATLSHKHRRDLVLQNKVGLVCSPRIRPDQNGSADILTKTAFGLERKPKD
jgi:hypothetical protein